MQLVVTCTSFHYGQDGSAILITASRLTLPNPQDYPMTSLRSKLLSLTPQGSSPSNGQGRGRPAGVDTSVEGMLDRHKEAGRLFAAGLKGPEVAERLGMHPAYMSRLRRHPNVESSRMEIHMSRDQHASQIREQVEQGARSGLQVLVDILTPDTVEFGESSNTEKIRVAQDLLDRDGVAPRISRTQKQSENTHLHLTGDDIQKIKDAAMGKRDA